eukprot:581384-Pyramimonas_sp.AAC.1
MPPTAAADRRRASASVSSSASASRLTHGWATSHRRSWHGLRQCSSTSTARSCGPRAARSRAPSHCSPPRGPRRWQGEDQLRHARS